MGQLDQSFDPRPAEVVELNGQVDRRPRWLLAVAAILIVVLVGSFAVSRSSDDSHRHGDVPTPSTDLPVTTSPRISVVDAPASAPSFVPTGGLQTAQDGYADCFRCPAVRLNDGRVLVAVKGGGISTVLQAFDPATGTFSIIGRLDVGYGLNVHEAPLADDRVILTGLDGGAFAIFDPGTGGARIIPTGTSNDLDWIPVVLTDGRVLMFSATGVSELDLDTGGLTAIANVATPMPDGISIAVPFLDGRELVMGHPQIGGDPSAEIFDPTRGTFAATGVPHSAMTYSTAIRLLDGRVLLVGYGTNHTAEVYDPDSGTFSVTGPLPDQSDSVSATMALLPDGRVLIVFASSRGVIEVATTAIFDPATGTFTAGPRTGRPRLGATAITLKDGRVLVVGSYRGNAEGISGDGPSSAEIFQTNGSKTPHG